MKEAEKKKVRKCPICGEENDSGEWYIATSDMSVDYATCCETCHKLGKKAKDSI